MNTQVSNQVPPFDNVNLYTSDPFLQSMINRWGSVDSSTELSEFGLISGSKEMVEHARLCNENPPKLNAFDRFGRRVNEVEYHPSYHALMATSMAHGLHTRWWSDKSRGKLVERCAKNYMMTQTEAGHGCPITMTFAAVPALQTDEKLASLLVPKLLSSQYDSRNLPLSDKTGGTVGMAMTEKQGGSDVRANITHATAITEDTFKLNGHKWFCSAPMSDLFLTLAYVDDALTCFVVPRWTPDRQPNTMQIQRLKNKVGNRSNASSEIEYENTFAWRLGAVGRGVPTIIEMVTHTRLDCIVASASNMRFAAAHAIHHAAHRKAFGQRLLDQPLMRNVLADLSLEAMVSTAMAFRIACSYEPAPLETGESSLSRLWTAVGKYWVCKRAPHVVTEAMECHGGNGFVEPNPMARLYREAPLNSIWEGSGNVICLDVLRTLQKHPESVPTVIGQLMNDTSGITGCAERIERLKAHINTPEIVHYARRIVEDLSLLYGIGSLAKAGYHDFAELYASCRLVDGGVQFGQLPPTEHMAAILNQLVTVS